MRKLCVSFIMLSFVSLALAQIDKEQLALDVAKADAANLEQLKAFIWKRNSTATVAGEVKATALFELSFDENGELKVTQIDAQSNVKQKPGLRGRAQQSVMEDNVDYVGDALEISAGYAYMSKGQMLDFVEKSEVTEEGDTYLISGESILVEGDKLIVVVEKSTKLFLSKKFSSLLGADPVDGEIKYGKFSSGISHVTETVIKLPSKNAIIDAKNTDYSQRIN